MPTSRPATLNGVKGSGYAELVRTPSGLTDYRGVMTVDNAGWKTLSTAMNEDRDFTFSGAVFDGARERQGTIPVLVENITSHGGDTSLVRFVGRGGGPS
jgi:hypothetical protein